MWLMIYQCFPGISKTTILLYSVTDTLHTLFIPERQYLYIGSYFSFSFLYILALFSKRKRVSFWMFVCAHTNICVYISITHLYAVYAHKVLCVYIFISSVQSLSHVRLFVTPWITAGQASLSITSSWSLPKPMSIESVMPSSHLILCHPLLLLPPNPSQH